MNDQDRDNRIENLEWMVGGLTASLLEMFTHLLQEDGLSNNLKQVIDTYISILEIAYFQPWNEVTKPDEPIPSTEDGAQVAFHYIPHDKES